MIGCSDTGAVCIKMGQAAQYFCCHCRVLHTTNTHHGRRSSGSCYRHDCMIYNFDDHEANTATGGVPERFRVLPRNWCWSPRTLGAPAIDPARGRVTQSLSITAPQPRPCPCPESTSIPRARPSVWHNFLIASNASMLPLPLSFMAF